LNIIQNLCLLCKIRGFILAIESSCDDTAAAVLHNDKVLSNVVANQEIHTQYGGVVPELASRTPTKYSSCYRCCTRKANIDKEQLSAIAFTQGPINGVTSGGKFFCKINGFGLIHTSQ
jgi:N6-L-threonylcarbamoyladenine synthase